MEGCQFFWFIPSWQLNQGCVANDGLRFKLARGLGDPWFRDGGTSAGMVFIAVLYLPGCNVQAQL